MRRFSVSLLIAILAGTALLYVQGEVPSVQAVPTRTITYVVQPGDTLFAISLRHRISVQELMTLNGLSRSVVYVGQTLNVPEPTDQLGLPLTAQIANIGGQMQALPLDCEVRSAVDWAAFFGVSIDEYTFLSQLPLSDNPEKGFVGNVYGWWGQIPPGDYGVHAEPIAALLRVYQLPAVAQRDTDWNVVRAEIAANRPVIVWVTGHVENLGSRTTLHRSSMDKPRSSRRMNTPSW